MNRTAWLAQRALLAIGLMAGFYALAFGIAAAFVWIPYAGWTYLELVNAKVAFLCLGMAGAIVVAVMPRPDRLVPPGPRLDDTSHPELFAVIRDVASATKQDVPLDVFLLNHVNAFVAQRGGIMGFGSHRVMGLGLPLLQGLTVSEFKSVLAHEFGHYAAGDVKLGPWIHKTRAATARAVASLEESWVSGVFTAYGKLFLHLTHAISREQEFLADALAARTVSPEAMVAALRKTEALAPAFASYWTTEVGAALDAGFLPPIARGFQQFLSSGQVSAAFDRLVTTSEAEGATDALDTHPPLRERVAALNPVAPIRAAVPDDRPAVVLLRDAERDAISLLEFAAGVNECDTLRRVDWSDLARVEFPARWRAATAHYAAFLQPYATDTVPWGRRAYADAGKALSPSGERDLRIAFVVRALSMAVAVALLDMGAVPEHVPGKPMVFRNSSASMEPFAAIARLAEGTLSLDEWKVQCEIMGIAGRPLAPATIAA